MRTAYVLGIGCWSADWPSWDHARACLRGSPPPLSCRSEPAPPKRPVPDMLPPAERRRAPDTVAVALHVAAQAVAAAGVSAHELPCVFTSAHGDLPITDHLCRTLATTPTLLSPTKFHHSVHNAAAGYWTIAAGCQRNSTALSAHVHSVANGLLEALTLCALEAQPVLLVAYDVAAVGPLKAFTPPTALEALALVLSPFGSPATPALTWSLGPPLPDDTPDSSRPSPTTSDGAWHGEALRASSRLLARLATWPDRPVAPNQDTEVALPLSAGSTLRMRLGNP